jgi:predicted O-methyltransferase YrrM
MHPRLTELINYIDREQWDLSTTVRAIPEDERRTPPARGRWSVVDVIEHLALIERRLASRFVTWMADARARGIAAETDSSPILPSINTARVLDRTTRVVAPEPARPTGQVPFDDAWRAFQDARAEIKRVIETGDGLALGQIVQAHPVLGPLNMYEWISFVGAHTGRHAAQIVEIGTSLAAARRWTAVDEYIADRMVPSDPALDAALAASTAAALPAIQVAPNQGKLLQMLARMIGARAILEIGTLGGYSTIWLARALPAGGRLVTLEADAKHADVARTNITRAGLSAVVDLRLGRALDTLPNVTGPFDLVFIDADKPAIPDYFRWALKLTRSGALIIVDNVIRDGDVVDAKSSDVNVIGVRQLNDLLATETQVTATTIQTVGVKGYDGLMIAIRN